MSLTVGIPAETLPGERRVALVPEVISKLTKKGLTVVVESGAGVPAAYPDALYEKEGARVGTRKEALGADIVLKVQPPTPDEIALLKPEAVLIGFLNPLDQPQIAAALAARGVTALAMELVPRTSRAQKMDALSAMGAVAGYKAALIAADMLPKFFPLLTTAAGTVRPANVLVLGAGVAGLQAIATARRLGARVQAYDVRAAVKEEIQSLGASFIELELEAQDAKETGGYAKALAEEQQRRQVELLTPYIQKSDVVISTALIPGRKAPLLVTRAAVEGMAHGSVVVDLAAPNGGNCELTQAGETVVTDGGVRVVGPLNLATELSVHASQMYARCISTMLLEFTDGETFNKKFSDDIFKGSCVTDAGAVVHERVQALLAA